MGRGRSLYQEYSWWGKCWLLTCLGETDKGRVCERWPGRPPGLTPGWFFPGVGAGGLVLVLGGGAQDEDKHKAPTHPLRRPLSLRQPNDCPDPNLTPIWQ